VQPGISLRAKLRIPLFLGKHPRRMEAQELVALVYWFTEGSILLI